jgi:hypothetical protein
MGESLVAPIMKLNSPGIEPFSSEDWLLGFQAYPHIYLNCKGPGVPEDRTLSGSQTNGMFY